MPAAVIDTRPAMIPGGRVKSARVRDGRPIDDDRRAGEPEH